MSLWDEPNRGRHHFARQLSHNNNVIWVNRRLDRTDKRNNFIGIETISDNLSVLHTGMSFYPTYIPRRIDDYLNVNNIFRFKILRNYLILNNINPDLVWIYDYKAVNVAKYYRNKCRTLYFCNDFFGKRAETFEFKLIKMVDYVFSTDPRKQLIFSRCNLNSFFLPHGTWPITPRPIFSKKIEPETIGYVGTLNDTLDVQIFSKILERTNFNIVIAGPFAECNDDRKEFFTRLFQNQRVHYLGNLDRDEIVITIRDIDICLLPYHSEVNGFPLKFFDYLNFGKPIISSIFDFQWPSEFLRFLSFYNNEDINLFILKVYQEWDRESFNEALKVSERSRWIDRVNEMSGILNMKL